ALLHVVETLNELPTKSLGLVSPHEKLYGVVTKLSELRTWGCLTWVRIPPESRQRKEKLQSRARLCLLLGCSDSTKGYKFLDLITSQVVTAQGGNIRFHEAFTANGDYVKQLLENAFLGCAHELPSTVPVERIKTTMDTYIAAKAEANPEGIYLLSPDDKADHISESRGTSAAASAEPKSSGRIETSSGSARSHDTACVGKVDDSTVQFTNAQSAKKTCKGRYRKRSDLPEKATSAFKIQSPPVEPCVKRPRRAQKPNLRLLDYVVGHVQSTMEGIAIPATHKQALASKQWPQWKNAMLSELQYLKGHKTWKLVSRAAAKKVKVITCRWVFAVKRDERGRITGFKAAL
ncbi:polyprotein, partial [Phytophthora megakarya]